MAEIKDRLAELFDLTVMLEAFVNWLPSLVAAVALALAFWVAWRVIKRVMQAVFERSGTDPTAAAFVRAVSLYALGAIAIVSVLGQLGINTGSLIASLGVAGLTIGFAARDALSNVISGLFIFWDRPFVIGDLVEVDGRYGTVEKITMRSTRLVTPDGKMLAIPNSTVVNTPVASYTNVPHLRVDVPVTVGVGEDLGRVRRLLLDVVQEDPRRWLDAPTPAVVVTALGDYNLEVELRAWLTDERQHLAARVALREAIFEKLRGAGVDMPFETLQIQPLVIHTEAA